MKSVCRSGTWRFITPSPGPRPNRPPAAMASCARSIWWVSALSGLRNLCTRLATVAKEKKAPPPAGGGGGQHAEYPSQGHPGDEEGGAEGDGDQDGLAD